MRKEQRQEAYLNLIHQLLTCPDGQEPEVLEANQDLMDDGLVETIKSTVEILTQQGDKKTAEFLQYTITFINKWIRHQEQMQLIHILLDRPREKQKILNDNAELIDAQLVDGLEYEAKQAAEQGDQAATIFLLEIAADISAKVGGYLDWGIKKLEANYLLLERGIKQQQSSQFQSALKSFQKSLRIYREIEDKWGEGEASGAIGNNLMFLGRYDEAIQYNQQHLEIARSIQNREGEMGALGNLGNVYASLSEHSEAVKFYQQQLDIAQEIQNNRGLMSALANLAISLYSLGNLGEAIQTSQKSLEIARENQDRHAEGAVLGTLGISYYGLANYPQAKKYFEAQLKIAREINDLYQEGNALGNLGPIYFAQENFSKAVELLDLALAIHRRIRNLVGEASSLANLGHTYSAWEKYGKAIWCYERCLLLTKILGNKQLEGQVLGGLGLTFLSSKNYRKAIEYSRQHVDIAREFEDLASEANSLNNLGVALLFSGKPVEAEEILRDGISRFEKLRKGLQVLPAQDRDTQKISVFEQQMRCYVTLQEVLIAQNKINEALEVAERGRTRAFVELLVERLLSPDLAQSTDILDRVSTESPTITQIQKLAQEQEVTFVEYSILHDYKIIDTGSNAIRLTTGFKLFIWVIQPTGEIAFQQLDLKEQLDPLGDTLESLVLQARESIGITETQQNSSASVNQESSLSSPLISKELQQLHQLLIEPIVHFLPNNPNAPVFFIPTGNLFLVPFPALQDEEGKFLIEKHTILTAPSIQVLELIQKQSKQARETSLEALVVGNPKMPTIPLTLETLSPLEWAEAEANAIAPIFHTQPITGQAATKVNIVEQISKARIIHLATHGLLDDIRQLGVPGAIALAPSNNDNGFLTAGEIYHMKLNAQLVVLSACSTGRGRITGDGVVGLSRCLIAAGVPSIIVSLWSVNDQSTALLMVKFYQILQQGITATVALNQAQLWLRDITKAELKAWITANSLPLDPTMRHDLNKRLHKLQDDQKPFRDPFHWAAFCAIGQ